MTNQISDRFIPPRSLENQELSTFLLANDVSHDPYQKRLFQHMFSLEEVPPILNFWKKKKYTPIFSNPMQELRIHYPFPECTSILDAPGILNDFYSHPLTSDKEFLNVALGTQIYSYNLPNKKIYKLLDSEHTPICIDLHLTQSILNIGTKNNNLSQLNLQTLQIQSKIIMSDYARITRQIDSIIYAGCDEGTIVQWDTRGLKPTYLPSDSQKVCNIAINKGKIAVGFNDNSVKIWDIRKIEKPYAIFDQFSAAVKALAWHPNGNLIAGGGTQDKTIKVLNVNTNRVITSIDSKTQVTNIHLNNEGNRLISTHGFNSESPHLASCKLWSVRNNTLTFQSSSKSQDQRFLHSTVAEGNSTFIASNGETLHIYGNAFPSKQPENTSEPFTFDIR